MTEELQKATATAWRIIEALDLKVAERFHIVMSVEAYHIIGIVYHGYTSYYRTKHLANATDEDVVKIVNGLYELSKRIEMES